MRKSFVQKVMKAADSDNTAQSYATVESYLGSWRVLNEHCIPIWESRYVDEALDIAKEYDRLLADSNGWRHPIQETSVHEIRRGMVLEITPSVGIWGDAYLYDEGKRIGWYRFQLTQWPGSFIIGAPSLNGGMSLADGYTGAGLCALVYDTVEAVYGMKIVPHGSNGVGGTRTAMSKRFWDKRLAQRSVPGFCDPATAARLSRWGEATSFIEIEQRCSASPHFLALAADKLDWKVKGAFLHDELLPMDLWCVCPDGPAFNAKGFFDDRYKCSAYGNDADISIKEISGRELLGILNSLPSRNELNDCSNWESDTYAILSRHDLGDFPSTRNSQKPLSPSV
jgi:hypothetical protein